MPNFNNNLTLTTFSSNLQARLNALTNSSSDDDIADLVRSAELFPSLNFTNVISVIQNRINSAQSSSDPQVIADAAIFIGKISNDNSSVISTVLSSAFRIEAGTQDIQGDTARIEADTQDIQSTVNNIQSTVNSGLGGFTVQSGSINLSTSEAFDTATIGAVDLLKSYVKVTGISGFNGSPPTETSSVIVGARLTNSTTVEVLRSYDEKQVIVYFSVITSN